MLGSGAQGARKVVCRHGQNIKKQMDTLSYKTVSANKATAQKEWVVIDAEGQVLGRMCSKVAKLHR